MQTKLTPRSAEISHKASKRWGNSGHPPYLSGLCLISNKAFPSAIVSNRGLTGAQYTPFIITDAYGAI